MGQATDRPTSPRKRGVANVPREHVPRPPASSARTPPCPSLSPIPLPSPSAPHLVRVGHLHGRPILQGGGQADKGKGFGRREAAVQANDARPARRGRHDLAQAGQAAAGALLREHGRIVDGDGGDRGGGEVGRRVGGAGALGVGGVGGGRVGAWREGEATTVSSGREREKKERGCLGGGCDTAPPWHAHAHAGQMADPTGDGGGQDAHVRGCVDSPRSQREESRQRRRRNFRSLPTLTFHHRHARVDGHGVCFCEGQGSVCAVQCRRMGVERVWESRGGEGAAGAAKSTLCEKRAQRERCMARSVLGRGER